MGIVSPVVLGLCRPLAGRWHGIRKKPMMGYQMDKMAINCHGRSDTIRLTSPGSRRRYITATIVGTCRRTVRGRGVPLRVPCARTKGRQCGCRGRRCSLLRKARESSAAWTEAAEGGLELEGAASRPGATAQWAAAAARAREHVCFCVEVAVPLVAAGCAAVAPLPRWLDGAWRVCRTSIPNPPPHALERLNSIDCSQIRKPQSSVLWLSAPGTCAIRTELVLRPAKSARWGGALHAALHFASTGLAAASTRIHPLQRARWGVRCFFFASRLPSQSITALPRSRQSTTTRSQRLGPAASATCVGSAPPIY